MDVTRNHRALVGLGATLVLLACAVVATGAWVSAAVSPGRSSLAHAGKIDVVAGYLRVPRGDWVRPETAAPLVVWLHNRDDVRHVVVSASSPYAARVVIGGSPVAVPARGWASSEPGTHDLSLQGLRRPLRAGDTVPVTLSFADGRHLRARVPVVTPAQADRVGQAAVDAATAP